MKRTMIMLSVSLALCAGLLFGQGTRIAGGGYELLANAYAKTKTGKVALTAVRPLNVTKEEALFGFWLSAKGTGTETVIELKEGARSVAAVNAKDFAAKAKVESNGSTTTATYVIDRGGLSATLVLSAELVSDVAMPNGSAVLYTLSARSASAKTLSAELTLHADGFVQKVGANGLSSSRVEKGKPAFPYVLALGINGTSVTVEKGDPKLPGRSVKFIGAAAAVGAEPVPLIAFRSMLTTVASVEKALVQSNNIEQSISVKKNKTELALLNSASKLNPFPGDTITYYITYHNIGTSPAEEIAISNPIPANTVYLEKSAEGENTEITLERKKANLPQIGAVTSVSWKVKKRINPGEEGTVSLKAVIR